MVIVCFSIYLEFDTFSYITKEPYIFMCILKFFEKYHQQIAYLFFGILTTLVNYGSFWLSFRLLGPQTVLYGNTISFFLATAFAYVTNKRYVFQVPDWRLQTVVQEFASFTTVRLFSFGLEELGLLIGTVCFSAEKRVWLGINGTFFLKFVLSLSAVLLNYLFSRYWIFRKKQGDTNDK